MEKIKNKYSNNPQKNLKDNYRIACQDVKFTNLIHNLDIKDNIAMRYTTSLQTTINELDNCQECRGLFECQNRFEGHIYYPNKNNDKLDFNYVACRYEEERRINLENKKSNNKEIDNARMKDIDITDKKRVKLIKWLKQFYDKYDNTKNFKGLYLHGSFGSGKTYLISALFNELKINKKVTTAIVYLPELLRDLKDNWDEINMKINYYQGVDLLLIDDIGAEKVSEWGRDEILGTILQSRMNNNLCTFFTSNLTITELEQHLALTKSGVDSLKARRIIERIKQLTIDMELISSNKRNLLDEDTNANS